MDIESFYQLTPDEFEAIYIKWSDKRDADLRVSWEQTRLICYHAIKPYLKKATRIGTFMPLPWDKKKKTEGRKQDPERFERLAEKYGKTI